MVDVYWYFVLCTTLSVDIESKGATDTKSGRHREREREGKGRCVKCGESGREREGEFQIAIGMCVKMKPPLAAYRTAIQFTYANTRTHTHWIRAYLELEPSAIMIIPLCIVPSARWSYGLVPLSFLFSFLFGYFMWFSMLLLCSRQHIRKIKKNNNNKNCADKERERPKKKPNSSSFPYGLVSYTVHALQSHSRLNNQYMKILLPFRRNLYI